MTEYEVKPSEMFTLRKRYAGRIIIFDRGDGIATTTYYEVNPGKGLKCTYCSGAAIAMKDDKEHNGKQYFFDAYCRNHLPDHIAERMSVD